MTSTFGERLIEARKAVGLSGNRLSELSGVDQAFLWKVEKGHRPPSIDLLKRIAPHVKVAYEVLQAWADAESKVAKMAQGTAGSWQDHRRGSNQCLLRAVLHKGCCGASVSPCVGQS